MLDTNTISYLMRKHPRVLARLDNAGVRRLCVSVVTEAEVRFGVAKRGAPARETAIQTFFEAVAVLPWTSATAAVYAAFRVDLEQRGRPLAPLDMMIAAHALEAGAVLVTSDRALLNTPGLVCEDWLI